MSLTLDDLFASPDHYLHSFEGDAALFMPMDREAYRRSIFLDGRIEPRANQQMRVPVAPLLGPARPPQQTGWIFHVAHCGSTLLARALDDPALNLVLREPLALRQLALEPNAAGLRLVLAMLGKRYRSDLPTLVKANVPVNFILPDIAAAEPDARVLFLHLGLRDYALAILRNDKHRQWLRRVSEQLARALGDVSGLADGPLLAALWLGQMRAFAAAMKAWPEARSLDAELFFAEPAPALKRAAAHLGVPLADEAIEALVAGPLFATYSKNPQLKFDNAMRLERRAALEAELAPDIDAAEAWLARNAADAGEVAAQVRGAALAD